MIFSTTIDAKSVGITLSAYSEVQSRQPSSDNAIKDFNIHSRQDQSDQSTLNETSDVQHGICYYNTTENSICLPHYEEWRNIHAAWHHPESGGSVQQQLGRSIIGYLDNHSHSRERCDKSPETCDWCRVGGHVEHYLNRLMKKVESICSLFAINELIHTGSSAEKTNIFRASEFDHLAILENFRQSRSDPNEITYTGNDPAHVNVTGEWPINVSKLLGIFQKSIAEAVEWIHCDYLSAPTVILGKTGVTMYFFYHRKPPADAMKISIDIAIGVQVVGNNANSDVVLVPQRPGSVGSQQWRLSYPTLERDMLLKADASVSRVYQLLKFLAALHHSRDNLKREIPRKSSLTTYVLKTCLFRYMHLCYRPEENTWLGQDALRHAFGVLGQFPLNSTEMTSFFNRDIVEFNVTAESKKAAIEIISKLDKMI